MKLSVNTDKIIGIEVFEHFVVRDIYAVTDIVRGAARGNGYPETFALFDCLCGNCEGSKYKDFAACVLADDIRPNELNYRLAKSCVEEESCPPFFYEPRHNVLLPVEKKRIFGFDKSFGDIEPRGNVFLDL